MRLAPATLVALALLGATSALGAQVPDAHWRTLHTAHFDVHFTPPLDATARRAAVDAEQAYAALAARLVPPRGPIDLVVADNVDFSNGATVVFPTNRILIYAHPPLDVPSLRYYDDWIALVITHELTHVFHIDRTRGWWRVAQHVFGRAPFLFPNLYDPGWMTEGLATYFESEVTGTGRVAGTHERMVVDAGVRDGGLYPFGQWNLATTRYPGGDIAYGFGSRFFDFIARTRGRDEIRAFIERASGAAIPFTLNRSARDAFGISFSEAWREWRDTLEHELSPAHPPLAGWRDVSRGGHLAAYPRWRDASSLLYSGFTWSASPAAYLTDTSGHVRRLGRRNGGDANAPLPGGGVVFSQLEFTDPYHVRADLYEERGGHTTRLTHGARLAEVDARRSDGALLAVRFLPATTQLVRVSADGRTITPLTPASPDTQWAEPRWSPRGDRIAATRWTRGGYADVVVLDSTGHLVRALTHDRAFDSTPSWTADGSAVLFTSDRTGVAEIYVAPVDGDGAPRRVSHAANGVFFPALSPNDAELAAVRYDADGWHVGVAPFDTSAADSPAVDSTFYAAELPRAASDTARATAYSPWRSLVPRFWLPVVAQTASGGYAAGAYTSGTDIVGRHAYLAQLLLDPRDHEHTFDAAYAYAGLGQPVIQVEADQAWDRQTVIDTTGLPVGHLLRRARVASLGVSFARPRIRDNAFLSLAGQFEARAYSTDPAPLIQRLDGFFRSAPQFWSLVGSAGWSNAQRPPLSISLEDGAAVSAAGEIRWLAGQRVVEERSVTVAASAYKSLALGGYAHHVLAAHAALGVAGGADPGVFDIGGSSGTPVTIFPGINLGANHTFAVRGFASGVESGTRALTASLEYRLPLTAPHRGFGFWPVFLDRTSLALFSDAGTAWIPPAAFPSPRQWLGAVGAELVLDTGLQYDVPYRLRLGAAVPVAHPAFVPAAAASIYFQLGFAF